MGAVDETAASMEPTEYEHSVHNSWIASELKVVRNSHNAFHYGMAAGMVHTGFASFVSRGHEPWTFAHDIRDCDATLPAAECKPIEYPKPDGVLSFDLLTNLTRSGE